MLRLKISTLLTFAAPTDIFGPCGGIKTCSLAIYSVYDLCIKYQVTVGMSGMMNDETTDKSEDLLGIPLLKLLKSWSLIVQ